LGEHDGDVLKVHLLSQGGTCLGRTPAFNLDEEMAALVGVKNGHVVLFSTNPIYRAETVGNYSLVLNTIMNFDNLNAGRKLAEK